MKHQRPLSPHLQVYKLPLTALMSISHRLSGVFLGLGFVGLSMYLVGQSVGGNFRLCITIFLTHWIGKLCLLGFWKAATYHCLTGLRHLLWDLGLGLNLKATQLSSYVILVLTTISVLCGLWVIFF